MNAQLIMKYQDFKSLLASKTDLKVRGRDAKNNNTVWNARDLEVVYITSNLVRQEVTIVFSSPNFMNTGDAELQRLVTA